MDTGGVVPQRRITYHICLLLLVKKADLSNLHLSNSLEWILLPSITISDLEEPPDLGRYQSDSP